MSLKDLIESDVQDVFLDTDEFAETVTRYSSGTGAGVSVTAIVTLDDGEVDTSSGTTHVHNGYCDVPEATIVNVKDSFTIRGNATQVTKVREADSGMKRFWFERVSYENRTHGYGDVL